MKLYTQYKGYLIDLDGTAYRGTELIPETLTFVKSLHEAKIPYLFLTNNSTKTPAMAAEILTNFGYPVTDSQVYTSSLATAAYIYEQNPHAKIFMIGEIGLKMAIEEKGFDLVEHGVEADYVVMGLDRAITYEKLTQACIGVRNGAKFVVTNEDRALPTERGFIPGNGAMASVVATSTGVEPIYIGKPNATIMNFALAELGLVASEVAMVGDNYHTDILAGIKSGLPTIFIEGGVSNRADVLGYDAQPTHLLKNLTEFL